MAKRRRKRTRAEKIARRERQKAWMTIFINGKQKRVRRPDAGLIEGIPAEEFIARNADPIWLHQNELWEYMTESATPDDQAPSSSQSSSSE